MNTKEIARNAILASVYVVLTLINPIGWSAWQFRISEIVLVIPFFNRKYILGSVVGVAIANASSPLGIIDVIVGMACCLIGYSASKYVNNNYINAFIYSFTAGVLVGLELNIIFNLPYLISSITVFIPTLIITILGVSLEKKFKISAIIE